MLFLVEASTAFPPELDADTRRDLIERERVTGAEHVAAGRLRCIWRVPGRQANIAVWDCPDADALHDALVSLPAWPWMSITVRPLATHPLQPG